MTTRRDWLKGFVGAGTTLLLAACAPAAPPAPTSAPAAQPTAAAKPTTAPAPAAQPTTAAQAATAAQPTAAPAAAATGSDTLRIAVSGMGNEALDPLTGDVGEKFFYTLIWDWLVDINANSEPDPSRSIAEKWDISPDNKTFTFHIRQGVKFQNGDDLTGEDVVFSLQRIVLNEKSQSAYAGNLRKVISGVELVDPYTVKVTTKDPAIFLLYDLSPLIGNEGIVLPKKYLTGVGDDGYNNAPIGSGPYKVVSHQKGDNLKLQAFDGYWRSKALKYKQIQFQVVPEEQTRAALLQRGEADIIDASARKSQELEQAGLKKMLKPGAYAVSVLLTEQWLAPFDNPKVREALNVAIDRKGLNDSLFGGLNQVTANYPVNALDIGYFAEPLYDYDPARARQLLQEAGQPSPKITIYSYSRAGISEGPQMMQAIAGMWQAVGAQVEIRQSDYGSFRTIWQKHSQGPGVAVYINAGGQVEGVGRLSATLGATGFLTVNKDPKLDELIGAAAAAPSIDAYKSRMKDMADYIRQNSIMAPLFEQPDIYMLSPRLNPWPVTRTASSWDLLNLVQ